MTDKKAVQWEHAKRGINFTERTEIRLKEEGVNKF